MLDVGLVAVFNVKGHGSRSFCQVMVWTIEDIRVFTVPALCVSGWISGCVQLYAVGHGGDRALEHWLET